MIDLSTIALAIGIGVGVAAIGVAIGQGMAANAGLTGMSRQPEAAGKIQTAMLIALAFIELVFLLAFTLLFMMLGKMPNYEDARVKGDLKASAPAVIAQSTSHNN